ncbi:SDR family NAD(P)-dependent oxidoreductase [uncultured Roseibium sp.]|uniref:SDR family NAD(P)-dependent oxidoreductase n=1 Tax=uncultured Roseibium sp. TaxID=1936171 RepID=UPI002620284E|nr:SDR family NAD(P)-dependent oxidoreductase [uncultured Roseibium sp.]
MTGNALIVGAGSGLSASLARVFSGAGYTVLLAARSAGKLADICEETGARAFACDATKAESVEMLFAELDANGITPDVVIYNASGRTRGPIAELDPDDVRAALDVTAFGAFLVAHEAAKRMVPKAAGTMLFTGASAGVKGFPQSAPFAMGKFALRGLCQSLARELHPKNIHVVHFVIDGAIHRADRGAPYDDPEKTLHPDEIARTYLEMTRQHRSVWTNEIELRPYVERF